MSRLAPCKTPCRRADIKTIEATSFVGSSAGPGKYCGQLGVNLPGSIVGARAERGTALPGSPHSFICGADQAVRGQQLRACSGLQQGLTSRVSTNRQWLPACTRQQAWDWDFSAASVAANRGSAYEANQLLPR